ncbi:MAG: helix-turn-helix transcriptional regulator [Ruminococcus sp.]|nr:helix-turn-helix transcriptional regulator [Ruminococcus sp.]
MAISMMKLQDIMDEKGIKKFDLRKAGFNPNIIDKVLSGTLNKSKRVDTETINRLCKFLNCQPADIMEYVEDSGE